jgi:hypothetical protein
MEATNQQKPQIEITWWHHAVIFLFACAVVVSRQPDAVFNAQFWAEDGHVWFADAYNLGWWSALFRVFEGYIEVFPRLGAALALLVPLKTAPLILNLLAITVRALPVSLLLSVRSSAWGTLGHRAMMAGIYLTLPNTGELNATITNSQWFLAFSVFLMLVGSKTRNIWEWCFDLFILLLCALSGPFCIFLLPIAAFLLWMRREQRYWLAAGVFAAGSFIQGWNLINGGLAGRFHGPLGASLTTAVKLFATQLYIGAWLGPNRIATIAWAGLYAVFIVVAVGGAILTVLCLLKTRLEYRLFFMFSAMVLVAALKAPLTTEKDMAPWAVMVIGWGTRYWFFPCLWLTWSVLKLLNDNVRTLRVVSGALLCVLFFGILLRWRIPALPDTNFAENAIRFESAPAGTEMVVPVIPDGWNMRLVKRANAR